MNSTKTVRTNGNEPTSKTAIVNPWIWMKVKIP